MGKFLVGISNALNGLRRRRVAPEQLLLLVPHCLQRNDCQRNVRGDLANCARCGKCPIDAVLALAEKYGVRVELASGGRKAVAAAKASDIKAVVAVACHKELSAGLKAVFPKAAIAVPNRQPEGPCVNTTVDVEAVEDAIRRLLKKSGLPGTVDGGNR
jgi:hypothetical protein